MKMLTINKLIITGDYANFINENVVDGKLIFTNLVAMPDNLTIEQNNYYIIKYHTDDLMLDFNQDGDNFTCSMDSGSLVVVEYNEYYTWCRFNIGCATNSVDVFIDEISNESVILRFLSPVSSPLHWTMKLKDSYPELGFHSMSLNETGTFCSVISKDDRMDIEYISQSFRVEDLQAIDCKLLIS